MKHEAIKISGKIIKGDGYGKRLGFPTANLDRRDYSRRKMKIRLGIYSGTAAYTLHAIRYTLSAAIVIGPLDKIGLPKIEAHLMGFKGNLYGKKVVLHLEKYLRQYKLFRTVGGLKQQIQRDLKRIRELK